jgi:tetratricopeptide (TPR) repeat protein
LSRDYEAAQAYFKEAAEEMRRTGNIYFNRLGMISLAYIAQNQGDFQTARSIFTDCLAIFQEYGDLYFTNVAHSGLADTARLEKIYPEAVQRYLETLSAWQELGNQGAVARCLECLAFIAGEQAQSTTGMAEQEALLRQTGNLLGTAEALREANASTMTQEERSEYDQEIATFRKLPSREAFGAGWRQGREMSIEQAKAVAEGLLPE